MAELGELTERLIRLRDWLPLSKMDDRAALADAVNILSAPEESDQPRLREALGELLEAWQAATFGTPTNVPRLDAALDRARAALEASTEESVGADGLSEGGSGTGHIPSSQGALSAGGQAPPLAESDPGAELERVASELDARAEKASKEMVDGESKLVRRGAWARKLTFQEAAQLLRDRACTDSA